MLARLLAFSGMEVEAPAVLAVVVLSNPGEWFSEVVAHLKACTTPRTTFVFVDRGCPPEAVETAAREFPGAFIMRPEGKSSYASSINAAVKASRGASHVLLCHDDVAPDPDALSHMLAECYRNNAGLVAPKYVSWDDPRMLESVGLASDRLAVPLARVETGELDQGQHDAVAEVAVAPGGFVLCRADLFLALGGLDEKMEMFGEDVDFSWRARLAGARVIVDPGARVRHLRAGSRNLRGIPPLAGFYHQRRNEIRTVLKCHKSFYLFVASFLLVVFSALEAALAVLFGNLGRAGAICRAWLWNLKNLRDSFKEKRQLDRVRRLGPGQFWASLSPRYGRLSRFLDSLYPEHSGRLESSRRDPVAMVLERRHRYLLAFYLLSAVVLLFGARSLLSQGLPVYGSLSPFPSAAGFLRQGIGLVSPFGSSQIPNPWNLFLGVLGFFFPGSQAAYRLYFFLALLWVGPVSLFHLAGRLSHDPLKQKFVAPLAGALVYAMLPPYLGYLKAGSFKGLLAWALAPMFVSLLFSFSERSRRISPAWPSALLSLAILAGGVSCLFYLVPSFMPAALIWLLEEAAFAVVAEGSPARLALRRLLNGVVLLALFSLPLLVAMAESVPSGVAAVLGSGFDGSTVVQILALDPFRTRPLAASIAFVAVLAVLSLVGRRVNPELDKLYVFSLLSMALALPESKALPALAALASPVAVSVTGVALACGTAAALATARRLVSRFRPVAVAGAVVCALFFVLPLGGFLADLGSGRLGAPTLSFYSDLSSLGAEGHTAFVGFSADTLPTPLGVGAGDFYLSPSAGVAQISPSTELLAGSGRALREARLVGRLVIGGDPSAERALLRSGIRYLAVDASNAKGKAIASRLSSLPGISFVPGTGSLALFQIGGGLPGRAVVSGGSLMLIAFLPGLALFLAAVWERVKS